MIWGDCDFVTAVTGDGHFGRLGRFSVRRVIQRGGGLPCIAAGMVGGGLKMGLYEDREAYREAILNQPFDDQVKQIAKEMDRLAAFANDGKMFRMQVAGVLEAARSCGYELAEISDRGRGKEAGFA